MEYVGCFDSYPVWFAQLECPKFTFLWSFSPQCGTFLHSVELFLHKVWNFSPQTQIPEVWSWKVAIEILNFWIGGLIRIYDHFPALHLRTWNGVEIVSIAAVGGSYVPKNNRTEWEGLLSPLTGGFLEPEAPKAHMAKKSLFLDHLPVIVINVGRDKFQIYIFQIYFNL